MNKLTKQVRQFHNSFDQPSSYTPTKMIFPRRMERVSLIMDELGEFISADTLHEQVKELGDAAYLIAGTFVEMGVWPEKILTIIHKSNMTKLWDDGKPRFRKNDHKVIKPNSFEQPYDDICTELNNQSGLTSLVYGWLMGNDHDAISVPFAIKSMSREFGLLQRDIKTALCEVQQTYATQFLFSLVPESDLVTNRHTRKCHYIAINGMWCDFIELDTG